VSQQNEEMGPSGYSRHGRFAIGLYVFGFLAVGLMLADQDRLLALAFMVACGTMCDMRTLPDRKSKHSPAAAATRQEQIDQWVDQSMDGLTIDSLCDLAISHGMTPKEYRAWLRDVLRNEPRPLPKLPEKYQPPDDPRVKARAAAEIARLDAEMTKLGFKR
jgi:hypothetical protein